LCPGRAASGLTKGFRRRRPPPTSTASSVISLARAHPIRKARAEVAAYADCTESQMMAMFGWTDPKMPAHYIAQANREKLGMSGMDKVVAFDQSQSLDDFMPLSDANRAGTSGENNVVTLAGNIRKKA
jgi:hypothetical protein